MRATAILLAASLAIAGRPAGSAPGPTVSEFVVPGGPPPAVTASYPAQGDTAPAGALVIKLVFDRPMAPDSWSYGPADGGDFPQCLGQPRLLADGRTFALLCSAAEDRTYAVSVNPAPAFAAADGRLAKPYVLRFSTAKTETLGLHEALERAGLTDADDPVMTWKDPGRGVSRSQPVAP